MADKPEHSTGSFLQSAIVGAPLAAGVGIGVQRMLKETSFHNTSSATNKNPLVESTTRAKSVTPVPIINREIHLRFMNGNKVQEFIRGRGSDITRIAWDSAISQIDPLASQRLKTITSGPSTNLPNTIAKAMEIETSKGAQKAFSIFRKIMNTSMRQESLLKTIPKFDIYDPVVPTGRYARLPSNLNKAISRMEKQMGARAFPQFFGENNVGTFNVTMPTSVGRLKMQIPTVQDGILFQGFSQQTKRIAPDVLLLEGGKITRLNRSEYLMRLYETSIVPQIGTTITNESGLRAATAAVWEEAIGGLELAPRWTGPGVNRYEDIRKHALDIRVVDEIGDKYFKLGVRAPTESEYGNILKSNQGKLFGGASPTSMAKGRVMEKDLSQWFTTPKSVDWSARIDQVNRKWFLTQEAQKFIKESKRMHIDGISQEQLSIFDTPTFRKDFGQYSSAQFSTAYLDPNIPEQARAIQSMKIGEGEALINPRVRAALASQTSTTVQLRPTERLENRIAEHLSGGDKFQKGEILGITTKGKPFVFDPSKMELLGSTGHKSQTKGTYMGVHYLEQAKMEQYGKVFGDIKAVLRFEKVNMMQNNIDVVATTDDLRKSPHRHNKQMLSRLWFYTKSQWDKGAIQRTERMQQFMETYHSLGIEMQEKAMVGNKYQHTKMIRGLMEVAVQEMKLKPSDFGSVFGAVPAMSNINAVAVATEAGASPSHIKAMQRGKALGFAGLMFDQPMKYGGAGRKATVEPRGFEILRSGILGDLGIDAAEDFGLRMSITNPEKIATHRALTDTLMSTIGELKAPKGANLYDLTRADTIGGTYDFTKFENFIQKGGGYIRAGAGQRDIFVPGPDITAGVRSFQNEAGKTIQGSLSPFFHDIAKSAAKLQSAADMYGPGDYTKDLERFQRDIYKHWAPSGKGMGAITRGKILGSRYERAVSTLEGLSPKNMNEVLISEGQTKSMLREMRKSGLYSNEAIMEMSERFASGKQVGAWLSRDPVIGPFSYQPINVRAVKGSRATAIAIPEMKLNIGVTVAGEETGKAIQVSRAVGLALDKDADNAAIILAGPDQEKIIRQTLRNADSEFVQTYAQHQVRLGLLKASKAGASETIGTSLKMIAETQKLRSLEAWVPRLSVQLTEAKRAAARNLTGQNLTNAMFAAEFIEQKAIGAKNLATDDIARGAISSQMGGIIDSLKEGNATNLYNAVRPMIDDDIVTKNMLEEGVTITKGMDELQRITGLKSNYIPGINLETTLKSLTESMNTTSTARTVDNFVSGRSFGGVNNLPENLGKVAATSISSGEGMMKKVSRAIMTNENLIAASGKGIIKHWKPIGLGFATTIALSNILSTPPKNIKSSAGRDVVNANMQMKQQKAADRMHPTDVHPPGQAMGNPTVPPMLHQNRVMMSPPGYSPQIQMYGRTRDNLSPSQIFGSMRRAVGNMATGGVSLHDNRSYASQFLATQGNS